MMKMKMNIQKSLKADLKNDLLTFENELEEEPKKSVSFDDLTNHLSDGLTIVVLVVQKNLCKNNVEGKHLEMLHAQNQKKNMLFCAVPPMNIHRLICTKITIVVGG